ncbi:exocyst complex component 5-like [Lytechinus variegatus]|uniref:exocyst complex component 5-like n=1 Tax=Lytechinus variegatus TaxID=7654 RepID=UPI001BB162E6|nr:exocyst complex component 5-like [Lytechinus variegatus]
MSSLKEFAKSDFDPEQHVEQLAWRVLGGDTRDGPGSFDPKKMLNAFVCTIEELKLSSARVEEKITKLEHGMKTEMKQHAKRISQLQDHNKLAFLHFQELDERINSVATKVVHLGDQLEGVNTPRSRAEEALKLIQYFADFMDDFGPTADIFNDPEKYQEAADVIQKLQLIAQELPQDQFDKPKKKIQEKYNQIEEDLIQDFRHYFQEADIERMKELANILIHFKGYNRCVDAFIEESQMNCFILQDVCEDLLPLCKKVNALIHDVFSSPESVMGRFVVNLYEDKLQTHVKGKLADKNDLEHYLKNLQHLYVRTDRLTSALAEYRLGSDAHLLSRLTKKIFGAYLNKYNVAETKHLREKMADHLDMYYKGLGHTKKGPQPVDRFQDLQNKIRTKAPLNIVGAAPVADYKGETFLSQELALNLLYEAKMSFTRCQLLSNQSNLAKNAYDIFCILIDFMCNEHIDYALELGLTGIPMGEPRAPPASYFFEIVCQANAIFHLLEKQFSDILVPLISSTEQHTECVAKKKALMEQMEGKLEIGVDRLLNAICGWLKHLLSTEQKKTDFRPEAEAGMMTPFSPACAKVISYMEKQVETIKRCMDGKNINSTLAELGIRFHRVVYDHLQQFSYNSMGAMLVICDVNEYRRLVKNFKVPVVNTLFEMLHALCNLLVVAPENLRQVITGEQLAGLDKSVVMSFVQLRSDFKTAKIAQLLR